MRQPIDHRVKVGPHLPRGYSPHPNFAPDTVVKVPALKNGSLECHARKTVFFSKNDKVCGKNCHAVSTSFESGSCPHGSPGQMPTFVHHHFWPAPLCRVPLIIFNFTDTLQMHCFRPPLCACASVHETTCWDPFQGVP